MSKTPSSGEQVNKSDKSKDSVLAKMLAKLAKMPFLKLLGLAIACYLPAFGLISLSFLVFVFFNPSQRQANFISLSQRKEIERIAERKAAEVIDSKLDTILNSQQQEQDISVSQEQSVSNGLDSVLLTGYIDGQVQRQAQIEAEKAATAKIEELKTNWTANLFNQITFAVIFTVASIFAAFAVKDVLTEFLKEQEKDRIIRELKTDLKDYISDEVEAKNESINGNIQDIESFTYWLEHESLMVKIVQTLNNLSSSAPSDSEKSINEYADKKNLLVIEKLLDRSIIALWNASDIFSDNNLMQLKRAENKILATNISRSVLSPSSQKELLEKLEHSTQMASDSTVRQPKVVYETMYKRVDNIFEVQLGLMITTLNKIKEDTKNSQEKDEIESLIESIFRYLVRDKRKEDFSIQEKSLDEMPTMLSLVESSKIKDPKDHQSEQ